MGLERIGEWLDRLSKSLTSLDHEAVSSCAAALDEARPQLAQGSLNGADVAVLLFRIRNAAELTAGADRLYSGWRRIASPAGSAYTPEGRETPDPRGSGLKVEG